jgi:hypothetical protein
MTARRLGPDGYRVVLPDGWIRLNVREDVDATVADALSDISFENLPRDERPKRRAAIEGRLRQAVANAKRIDAYAMYVPLKGMHGTAIPASFIVAEATDFAGGGPQEDVLAKLLTASGARPVTVDGVDAVRTEASTSGVDEPSGHEVPARQIVYTIPVPDTAQWLLVVYDVIAGAGMTAEYAAFVDALVVLFDGIMSTFRWNFFDRSGR